MTRIAGIILTGGQSRRFGADKARALFQGKPLITHVAERLAPQVSVLALAGGQEDYALGLEVLGDGPYRGCGPLAGLLSGLAWAATKGADFVVSAPCDLPLLPTNLVALLRPHADHRPAVLVSDGRAENACALWPVALRERLVSALEADVTRSLAAALECAEAQRVEVAPVALDGTFQNINTPADYAGLTGGSDPVD